jgi:hypothetical protein
MLLIGQMLFWAGLHNVDWSQNMSKLNVHMYYATGQKEENFFKDRSIFSMWEYDTSYMIGIVMMLFGMFWSMYFIWKMKGLKKHENEKIRANNQEEF